MAEAVSPPAVPPPSRLKDPLGNRPVPEVPLPASSLLESKQFWTADGKPRLDVIEEHLLVEGLCTQELILEIISKAKDEFQAEPNLLKLRDPITIVGDIHGQYYDLRQLLELGGKLDDTQYLFLGDYVDRGSFSIEVVTFLFSVKISCPSRFRMLRGNHESRQMTAYFNFREECEYKYDATVYDAIMDCFDCLPCAANINGQFLSVHGGLSPELRYVNDIASVDRFQEPPADGLLCDLLWSDPTDKPLTKNEQFVPNEVRGCAWHFGFTCTTNFLRENRLLSLIRAHEVQLEGYKMHKTNPRTGFPSVITVFSAPNYCDAYGNKGAVLMLDNSTLNVKQFHFTEHPYHLPNFMSVFEWSLPFMAEKITEMLQVITTPTGEEAEEANQPQPLGQLTSWTRKSMSPEQNMSVELVQKLMESAGEHLEVQNESEEEVRNRIRKKAMILGRMNRVYATLRKENDLIVKLKGVCPGHRLSPGVLLEGRDKIKSELDLFGFTEAADLENEKRPSVPDMNEELVTAAKG